MSRALRTRRYPARRTAGAAIGDNAVACGSGLIESGPRSWVAETPAGEGSLSCLQERAVRTREGCPAAAGVGRVGDRARIHAEREGQGARRCR